MKEPLQGAIDRLDTWIQGNGPSGWDPYDIKETPLYLKLQAAPGLLNRIVRRSFSLAVNHFPLAARKLLRVKPQINAKAMGLLLAAYTNLHCASGKADYLDLAGQYARWLLANRGRRYAGFHWGYPFDWLSTVFIPKNTPSAVVSATVGDGFYLFYKATKSSEYLRICQGICEFFTADLHRSVDLPDKLCFSYTPLERDQVHNANLFVGEFLVRIGKETGNREWVSLGERCANFALSEQQPEGFLPYCGLALTDTHSEGQVRTDHYHSGFEIRMLYKLWRHTGRKKYQEAYTKYFNWYRRHMFIDRFIPKIKSDSLYPINIHACAEAILCPATLLPDHPEQRGKLFQTLKWVMAKMEYRPGIYLYMVKKLPLWGEWMLKIPMFRWGQAWMLRALSELALNEGIYN